MSATSSTFFDLLCLFELIYSLMLGFFLFSLSLKISNNFAAFLLESFKKALNEFYGLYRIRSSCITTSDCPSQSLTA